MRKLTVGVVDDERIVRNGLKNCIEWELYGFQVTELFETSQEAFQYMKENSIDVMITDIRMPVMNGLELAARCRENRIETKFIILSGYDDFRYAQQAIRCGVEGYLLKPVKEKELIDVLETIRNRYFKEECDGHTNFLLDRRNYSKTVRDILECVNLNLKKEDLSLKWIADEVLFMNRGYLSKLFVKETGYKFSAYLMRCRMELALQILNSQKNVTVLEVAEQTGFGNNPAYFSTVFKKYYGCSPSEYGQIK